MRFLILFLLLVSHSNAAMKVALILDKGGKDDKSFNTSAYQGAIAAKNKLGIYLKDIEAGDDTVFIPALRAFASKSFDLIISIGVNQADAVKKVALEFPNRKFAIIDARINLPNVYSATFAEHEGSYLVGYIAAMKSDTDRIGFIGGMEIPLIKRFEKAFAQGAQKRDSKKQLIVNYVGATSDAWNNPTKAKEIALNQYKQTASVIFCPAGASNTGCFNAAAEKNKFAIGVDSNQNGVKPGKVLTSMLKRIDVAVYQVIEATSQGRFSAGIHEFDLKNKGIDWALDEHNKALFSKEDLQKIETVKQQIIAGKIDVFDIYKHRR